MVSGLLFSFCIPPVFGAACQMLSAGCKKINERNTKCSILNLSCTCLSVMSGHNHSLLYSMHCCQAGKGGRKCKTCGSLKKVCTNQGSTKQSGTCFLNEPASSFTAAVLLQKASSNCAGPALSCRWPLGVGLLQVDRTASLLKHCCQLS